MNMTSPMKSNHQHQSEREAPMPEQNENTSMTRNDEYDKFFRTPSCFEFRRGLARPAKPLVLNREVTFCGVTKSLREWIQESGIHAETIRYRIARGLDPLKALTTADNDGRFLRPLTAEAVESYLKAQRRATSGVLDIFE